MFMIFTEHFSVTFVVGKLYFILLYLLDCGPDSSVGMATDYGLEDP